MNTRVPFRFVGRTGVAAAVVLAASLLVMAGDAKEPAIDLTNLADATVWHQVNKKPYYISSALNILCDAPRPARVDQERQRNPHASTAVTVYVNDAGRAAMFSSTPIAFPVGSVIVKQKFDPNHNPETPLLSTVMIKRDHGFNAESGDWEYAVVSGDGREIRARGALANCIACHMPQKDSDYVFRSYLEH